MNSTQLSVVLNKIYPDTIGRFVNHTIHVCFAFGYSFLLLILCILFRKQQPLKSRGILPAFASIFTMAVAAFGFLNSLLLRTGATSALATTCMFGITMTSTVLYVCFIVVQIVQLTRFLLLQNASFERLKLVTLTNQASTKAARDATIKKIQIYRWLLSPAIPVVLLLFTAVLLIPLCALAYSYDIIAQRKLTYFYLVSGVSYLTSSVVVAFVALVDVAKNIKTFCPLHKYLINKDRLLFRVETLFGIFAIVVWTLVQVFQSYNSSSSNQAWYVVLSTALDVSKQFIFTTYISGGIPLLMVISTRVSAARATRAKSYFAVAPASTPAVPSMIAPVTVEPTITPASDIALAIPAGNELECLLKDEQGIKLLDEFVQAEYSVENLECWKALQQLKAADKPKRRALFLKLFNVFIKDSAPLQVNITADVKHELEQLQVEVSTPSLIASSASPDKPTPLENSEARISSSTYDLTSSSPAHQVDLAKFNNLESALCLNLRDSFIRLKQTYAYSSFLQGQKEKADMLKKMNFV